MPADENPIVNSIATSVIRTVSGLILGWITFAALKLGIPLDSEAVQVPVYVAVTSVVYAGVRWLETNVSPKWGWLLGKAAAPKYEVFSSQKKLK